MTPAVSTPAATAAARGRWRRRLLAAAAASCLALAAAELVARLLGGAPLAERQPLMQIAANRHRGWAMVPGLHYTYHHPVQINALGLRGPPIGAKQPGELRILALGDSLIYGQGVADDETVPHHLQRLLAEVAAAERPVTVINGGHRAYDTNQELGLLEELGDAIQPDVVIVFWFWNDILERDVDDTFRRLTESGPIVFDVGGRMEGATLWAWRAKQVLRRSALVMLLYDQWRAATAPAEAWAEAALVDAAMARQEAYVTRLLGHASARGFRLYFAPIPDPAALAQEHFSTGIVSRLAAILRRRGVPLIDLVAPLQKVHRDLGGRLPVIPYDFHYNSRGNQAIAQAVAERLVADGVVGPRAR